MPFPIEVKTSVPYHMRWDSFFCLYFLPLPHTLTLFPRPPIILYQPKFHIHYRKICWETPMPTSYSTTPLEIRYAYPQHLNLPCFHRQFSPGPNQTNTCWIDLFFCEQNTQLEALLMLMFHVPPRKHDKLHTIFCVRIVVI